MVDDIRLEPADEEMQRRGVAGYVIVGGRDCAITIFKNGLIDLEGSAFMTADQALALAKGLTAAAYKVMGRESTL